MSAIYDGGLATFLAGSTAVAGVGTDWVANVQPGDTLIGPDGRTYGIAAVVSAASLTIDRAYRGRSVAAVPYAAVRVQVDEDLSSMAGVADATFAARDEAVSLVTPYPDRAAAEAATAPATQRRIAVQSPASLLDYREDAGMAPELAALMQGARKWTPDGPPTPPHFGASVLSSPTVIAGSVPLRLGSYADVPPSVSSVELQRAIDYAASWAKFLEVPEGVIGIDGYKGVAESWSGGWAWGGNRLRPGSRVIGAGMGKTIIRNGAANWRSVLWANESGRYELRDLTIDGDFEHFDTVPLGGTDATHGHVRGEGLLFSGSAATFEIHLKDVEVVRTGHYGIGIQRGRAFGTMDGMFFRQIGGDCIDTKEYPGEEKQFLVTRVISWDGCGHNYVGNGKAAPHDNQAVLDLGGSNIVDGVRVYELDSWGDQLGNVGIRARARVSSDGSRQNGKLSTYSDMIVQGVPLADKLIADPAHLRTETKNRIIAFVSNSELVMADKLIAEDCYDGVRWAVSGDEPNVAQGSLGDVIALRSLGTDNLGTGIRLTSTATGLRGGQWHVEGGNRGVHSDAYYVSALSITTKGSTVVGVSATEDVARTMTVGSLSHSGNAADITFSLAAEPRVMLPSPVRIAASRTPIIDMVSAVANDSEWAGEYMAMIRAHKADTSGVGSGEFGRVGWRATGSSGSDAFFQAESKDLGGLFQLLFRASRSTFVVPGNLILGNETGPQLLCGGGSPEGVVAAPKGSAFHRTDGGAGTTLYVKESGSGNTGWVGK